MTITLSPGANAPVHSTQMQLSIQLSPPQLTGVEVDISAFLLASTGKVRSDDDMVFYGQPYDAKGAVVLDGPKDGAINFRINVDRIEADVEKIAFTATIHESRRPFEAFEQIQLTIRDTTGTELLQAPFSTKGMQETALILGELYRRQGAWKFRAIAQGFVGGLRPLAEHFGIEITDKPRTPLKPKPFVDTTVASTAAPIRETPSAPASPAPTPKVSLSKVNLNKSRPTVDLGKRTEGFGEIKINLNWNRGTTQKRGLLSSLRGNSNDDTTVDLDIGCLFELQNGSKGVIQALGNCFGSYQHEPFIQLMGDDRTGAQQDGEWLRINGTQWPSIRRLLVFAFIYKGAPNWATTDAIVTLYVPGEADIEIPLTEGTNQLRMCGVALLENTGGSIRVSREMRYVNGHASLDHTYGWNMQWVAGSKS